MQEATFRIPSVFSGDRVAQPLVFEYCFLDRCSFLFVHSFVYPTICGFWYNLFGIFSEYFFGSLVIILIGPDRGLSLLLGVDTSKTKYSR